MFKLFFGMKLYIQYIPKRKNYVVANWTTDGGHHRFNNNWLYGQKCPHLTIPKTPLNQTYIFLSARAKSTFNVSLRELESWQWFLCIGILEIFDKNGTIFSLFCQFSRLLKTKYLVFNMEIISKGQLISECLFEKIVWTKIPTKNLIDSAQKVLLRLGNYALTWVELPWK